jgi:exo-beta-1,3-glucanase (GH17 family)
MSNEAKELIVSTLTNEQLADYIDPERAIPKEVGMDISIVLSEVAKRLRNHASDDNVLS